jgi:hypothetical protein
MPHDIELLVISQGVSKVVVAPKSCIFVNGVTNGSASPVVMLFDRVVRNPQAIRIFILLRVYLSINLGQGNMRQVSVNGQCDVILLAVRPSGRRPENKLRPSLQGGELVERE